jgi:hypothetical protein
MIRIIDLIKFRGFFFFVSFKYLIRPTAGSKPLTHKFLLVISFRLQKIRY